MKILSINNNYNQTSFKGFERTVYKAGKSAVEENILHRNNTYALRSDILWTDLVKSTFKKYKNIEKVFTCFYACSDGREVQSFLIAMESLYGEKAVEKFCPILAKDYDHFVINIAKKNIYEFSEEEINRINQISDGKFDQYYEPVSKLDNTYKATTKLTDKIIYEVGDFTKEYKNLPKEKIFLSVRNCWPYFSLTNQYDLPKKLCMHFDKDATILIGQFDLLSQNRFDFKKNGFDIADTLSLDTVFVK